MQHSLVDVWHIELSQIAKLLYNLKCPPVCLSERAGMEENVNFSVVIKDRILVLLSEDSSDLRAFII